MPQAPYLFHTSIRENLLIASENLDDEALLSALKVAQLTDFVTALPQGLETIVGETGREISTGEMQRMAVARALLRNAPIYIFDEPTEGLDDRTAALLLDALGRRLAGKTLVIISHRERDLALVDNVFQIQTAPAV